MSSNKKNFFKTIFKSNGSTCGGCGTPKSTQIYQPIPKHSSTNLSQNTIAITSFRTTTSSSSSSTSSSGVEIINIRKSTTIDKEESNTSVSTSTLTDQPTHRKQVNKPKIVINFDVGNNSPSSISSSVVSLSGVKVKNDINNEGSNISVSISTSTTTSTSTSSAHNSESDQVCFHRNQKPKTNDMKIINSIAVEKESDDPYQDFRESMLQMIREKEIYSEDELKELLQCFLEINSPSHHEVIVRAFMEILNKIIVRSGSSCS